MNMYPIISSKYPAAAILTSSLNLPVKKSLVHSLMLNSFHVDKDIASDCLSAYYILHWSGDMLEAKLSVNVTLHHNNVEYLVVFHRTTRWDAVRATQIAVSFRSALPTYGLLPYALVKILTK